MIREITKLNIYTSLIVLVIISIIFRDITYSMGYLVGAITSNVNFIINYKFISLQKMSRGIYNPTINFAIRILLYIVVLTSTFMLMSEIAAIFAAFGCFSIKVGIFEYGVLSKGGKKSANN